MDHPYTTPSCSIADPVARKSETSFDPRLALGWTILHSGEPYRIANDSRHLADPNNVPKVSGGGPQKAEFDDFKVSQHTHTHVSARRGREVTVAQRLVPINTFACRLLAAIRTLQRDWLG